MQAAIAGSAQGRTPHRKPGIMGWLLMAPMLLWLFAFVVVPTGILLLYSFCERGTPVEYSFTWENYTRVFGGTEFKPLIWCVLKAVGIAIIGVGIDWIRSPGRSREERAESAWRVGVAVFITVLLWMIWSNLSEVFTGTYVRIFARSIFYAGFTTAACAVVGYPVAYFIGKASERWRNLLLMLVMIPFWTSFLIRTYAWITILNENGLMNAFLQGARITQEPISVLYTPGAVVLGLVYSYLPFMILPIYGSVEKLDNSLIEAAFDLGASPIRAWQTVILPLTQPGIIAGVLLVFIPSIGMFAITDLLGGKTVPMIGNVIQNQISGQARDWPFGAALGMTLLAMFAVAFWIATRNEENEGVLG